MVLFGIESGNQKSLDALKKGITLRQIREGIGFCKKAGIEIAGYFMIGNPQETEKDANDTLRLSKELGLNLATFGVTVAYPGTELYKWAIENKTLSDRFWYMNRERQGVDSIREIRGNLNLKDFPIGRQLKVVKMANRQFYFRPAYMAKTILRIRRIHDLKRLIKAVKELL